MTRKASILACVTCALWPVLARAELRPEPAKSGQAQGSILDAYMTLLDQKQLAGMEAESAEELSELVQAAQEALLRGQRDEALSNLLEAVEGPRFKAFEPLDEYHSAELLLVSLLIEQHALTSAQRVLDRMLARGPSASTFSAAYRRAIDVALLRGDLAASATRLGKLVEGTLPEDAASELAYLRGLAAYDRRDVGAAKGEFGKVGQRSRFFPNAQYMLGALAAQAKDFKEAEARFCKVATLGKKDALSFYADGRFYQVRDMAHLALGRVAHESARSADAFYYYFQVPSDSERIAEALFEAAWASYEGGDHAAALDGLDQLKARFPRSPYSAEAAVLRGYVNLSRCEFGAAEAELIAFEKTFGTVLKEIDQTLDSEAKQATLYRDLVARADSLARNRESGVEAAPDPDGILLALVSADSTFYRLHSQIRVLDAELARSGNVPTALSGLAARLKGRDAPTPRLDERSTGDQFAGHMQRVEELRRAVELLERDLRSLEQAKASKQETAALSAVCAKLNKRLNALEAQLRAKLRAEAAASEPSSKELSTRLEEDRRYVDGLRLSAQRIRTELEAKANQAGKQALLEARERLAQELRRARIGRIDAVMGSKRQVELQIESLAAGRFPPELVDPLRIQSLLRDDEEYWPFEGEDWPDEFVERYAKEPR